MQKAGCPLLVLSEPGQLVLYAQLIEFEFLDIGIFGAGLLLEGLDLSVEERMAVAQSLNVILVHHVTCSHVFQTITPEAYTLSNGLLASSWWKMKDFGVSRATMSQFNNIL